MQYHLFLIPGLGDKTKYIELATKDWEKKYDIITHVYSFEWKKKDQTYQGKQEKLIQELSDYISNANYNTSLLGTSAAGSVVINTYQELKQKGIGINGKLINVCGRLIEGVGVSPSLNLASRGYPSFKESVTRCERNLKQLTIEDKNRILTLRSFNDFIVPVSTIPIYESKNITMPIIGHSTGIAFALLFYQREIVNFIKS